MKLRWLIFFFFECGKRLLRNSLHTAVRRFCSEGLLRNNFPDFIQHCIRVRFPVPQLKSQSKNFNYDITKLYLHFVLHLFILSCSSINIFCYRVASPSKAVEAAQRTISVARYSSPQRAIWTPDGIDDTSRHVQILWLHRFGLQQLHRANRRGLLLD